MRLTEFLIPYKGIDPSDRKNQDSRFHWVDQNNKIGVFLISDGRSKQHGEVSSRLVTDVIGKKVMERVIWHGTDGIQDFIMAEMIDLQSSIQKTAGATLDVVVVDEYKREMRGCHIGDSRVYAIHGNKDIEQLTEDHKYDNPSLGPRSYMGMSGSIDNLISKIYLNFDGVDDFIGFYMVTDGVTDLVTYSELNDFMLGLRDCLLPEEVVKLIIDRARYPKGELLSRINDSIDKDCWRDLFPKLELPYPSNSGRYEWNACKEYFQREDIIDTDIGMAMRAELARMLGLLDDIAGYFIDVKDILGERLKIADSALDLQRTYEEGKVASKDMIKSTAVSWGTTEHRLGRSKDRIMSLEKQLADMWIERDTLLGERDFVCGDLAAVCDDLSAYKNDYATVVNERNTAVAEKNAAFVERDTALVERDTALGERDTALGERDTALGERDTAIGERDTALGERDTASEERDTVAEERDAIRAEFTNYQAEVIRDYVPKTDLIAVKAARDLAQNQLSNLTEAKKDLEIILTALKTEFDETKQSLNEKIQIITAKDKKITELDEQYRTASDNVKKLEKSFVDVCVYLASCVESDDNKYSIITTVRANQPDNTAQGLYEQASKYIDSLIASKSELVEYVLDGIAKTLRAEESEEVKKVEVKPTERGINNAIKNLKTDYLDALETIAFHESKMKQLVAEKEEAYRQFNKDLHDLREQIEGDESIYVQRVLYYDVVNERDTAVSERDTAIVAETVARSEFERVKLEFDDISNEYKGYKVKAKKDLDNIETEFIELVSERFRDDR
ncbi:MAG: protein phosphatase 2C domain-containing protein [Candidatus Woesearchaeota archaeon]